jgi:hypothetical protein
VTRRQNVYIVLLDCAYFALWAVVLWQWGILAASALGIAGAVAYLKGRLRQAARNDVGVEHHEPYDNVGGWQVCRFDGRGWSPVGETHYIEDQFDQDENSPSYGAWWSVFRVLPAAKGVRDAGLLDTTDDMSTSWMNDA